MICKHGHGQGLWTTDSVAVAVAVSDYGDPNLRQDIHVHSMYTYVYLSFHSIEQEAKSFKCQPNWVAQRRRRRRWSTNQLCARAGAGDNTEQSRT